MPKSDHARIAVVGAGVVGASIARELSQYRNLQVHLIEKEADAGWGVSKANTGVIHAGYDDEPERFPKRAKLCVEGNNLWHNLAGDLDIAVRWCGSLVVAFNEQELGILKDLQDRGERNGVQGLKLIEGVDLKATERLLSDMALAGLWAPSAGQISPWDAVHALVENAVSNGVKVHLNTEVIGINIGGNRIRELETPNGLIEADYVVNAAGLYADKISKMAGFDNYSIRPRRGEYMVFDKDAEPKVSPILFTAPTPISKGVVVTTTVDGSLMIGPNAEDLPPEDREDRSTTTEGLDAVWRSASNLLKKLPPRSKVIRFFSGLRPEPSSGDFLIKAYEVEGFIEASGMRSPGLTSAPAISQQVSRLLQNAMEKNLDVKSNWNPMRKRTRRYSALSKKEQEEIMAKNPSYGNVVCQDELVTEPEIIEAIKRGATTIDGVKFRTRAGMGTCQGSQCTYKIALILSKELQIPLCDVTFRGPGTEIGLGDVKALLRKEKKTA